MSYAVVIDTTILATKTNIACTAVIGLSMIGKWEGTKLIISGPTVKYVCAYLIKLQTSAAKFPLFMMKKSAN